MASVLNKDPFTYQEEKREFIDGLREFHVGRGTPIDKIPRIGPIEVDLFLLYRRVTSLGGWKKVNDQLLWEEVFEDLKIPRGCTNAEQALKHIYIRYLKTYETVHFFGEDPDRKDNIVDDDTPARKKKCLPRDGIPLKYNYEQHKLTDNQRETYGMSLEFVKFSDYDKLERALLSGLPNEVDFVFNVCTLLSNESKHSLKLENETNLLNLLFGHVGIFVEGAGSLERLYENGWRTFHKKDFIRFWFDTVKNENIRKMISYTRTDNKDPLCGHEVLHVGREMGVKDTEGLRITQLAIILRNLSFDEDNAKVLATHDLVFRFLMLCTHCSYGELRQLSLDTLGNLASQLILEPINSQKSNMIFELMVQCLTSADKFAVVRGLEMLSKLSQIDENEFILCEKLELAVYEEIVKYMTVQDIQLIVSSLEALYQLSELGETTTTKIAEVRPTVDTLVSLITVEAQSYGPNSLVGIKVVEYCPPIPAAAGNVPTGVGPPPQPAQPPGQTALKKTPSVGTPGQPKSQAGIDTESTTCNWIQATYEWKDGSMVPQLGVYAEYLSFCKKYQLAPILPSQTFLNCLKTVYPKTEVVSRVKDNGTKDVCLHGIAKRNVQAPFSINCQVGRQRSFVRSSPAFPMRPPNTPQSVPLTQTSPTLRQALSGPPKISRPATSLFPAGGATVQGTPSSMPASPTPNRTTDHTFTPPPPPPPISRSHVHAPMGPPIPTQGYVSSSSSASPKVRKKPGPVPKKNLLPRPDLAQQQGGPLLVPRTPGTSLNVNRAPPINQFQMMDTGDSDIYNTQEISQKDSAETKMVKTLLAKKLRHSQVSPSSHSRSKNSDHLHQQQNTFVHLPHPQQLNLQYYTPANQVQQQPSPSFVPYSSQSTETVHSQAPAAVVSSTSNQSAMGGPSQQFYMQPGLRVQPHNNQSSSLTVQVPPQTTNQQQPLSSPSPSPSSVTPTSSKKKKSKSKSKETSSSTNPSPGPAKSTHSSRPSSPKTCKVRRSSASPHSMSPRAYSPRSPRPLELEVCGEVERAKDFIQEGTEARIERVENKCLKEHYENLEKSKSKSSSHSKPKPSRPQPTMDPVAIDNLTRVIDEVARNVCGSSDPPDDVSDAGTADTCDTRTSGISELFDEKSNSEMAFSEDSQSRVAISTEKTSGDETCDSVKDNDGSICDSSDTSSKQGIDQNRIQNSEMSVSLQNPDMDSVKTLGDDSMDVTGEAVNPNLENTNISGDDSMKKSSIVVDAAELEAAISSIERPENEVQDESVSSKSDVNIVENLTDSVSKEVKESAEYVDEQTTEIHMEDGSCAATNGVDVETIQHSGPSTTAEKTPGGNNEVVHDNVDTRPSSAEEAAAVQHILDIGLASGEETTNESLSVGIEDTQQKESLPPVDSEAVSEVEGNIHKEDVEKFEPEIVHTPVETECEPKQMVEMDDGVAAVAAVKTKPKEIEEVEEGNVTEWDNVREPQNSNLGESVKNTNENAVASVASEGVLVEQEIAQAAVEEQESVQTTALEQETFQRAVVEEEEKHVGNSSGVQQTRSDVLEDECAVNCLLSTEMGSKEDESETVNTRITESSEVIQESLETQLTNTESNEIIDNLNSNHSCSESMDVDESRNLVACEMPQPVQSMNENEIAEAVNACIEEMTKSISCDPQMEVDYLQVNADTVGSMAAESEMAVAAIQDGADVDMEVDNVQNGVNGSMVIGVQGDVNSDAEMAYNSVQASANLAGDTASQNSAIPSQLLENKLVNGPSVDSHTDQNLENTNTISKQTVENFVSQNGKDSCIAASAGHKQLMNGNLSSPDYSDIVPSPTLSAPETDTAISNTEVKLTNGITGDCDRLKDFEREKSPSKLDKISKMNGVINHYTREEYDRMLEEQRAVESLQTVFDNDGSSESSCTAGVIITQENSSELSSNIYLNGNEEDTRSIPSNDNEDSQQGIQDAQQESQQLVSKLFEESVKKLIGDGPPSEDSQDDSNFASVMQNPLIANSDQTLMNTINMNTNVVNTMNTIVSPMNTMNTVMNTVIITASKDQIILPRETLVVSSGYGISQPILLVTTNNVSDKVPVNLNTRTSAVNVSVKSQKHSSSSTHSSKAAKQKDIAPKLTSPNSKSPKGEGKTGSKSKEQKPKKRSRSKSGGSGSGSQDSRCSSTSSVTSTTPLPEFMCEWAQCKRCFDNAKSVYIHVCKFHLSGPTDGVCRWEGCENLKRKRWSLFTHLQDHHCSEAALRSAAQRRLQSFQSGQQVPNPVSPAMVYPPDAAMQAIKRFIPKPPYPEWLEGREGPVTKHIRLTAALILRNMARYSAVGRSLIKKHERNISFVAMSAVESSTALSNCLWEVLHDH